MDFIDFQALKNSYPQDEDFQQDVVDAFIKRIPTYYHCLKTSLDRKNTEEILAYSCQLRGAADRCCVPQVEKLCLKLDTEIQDDDLKAAVLTFQKIRKILRSIQNRYPVNLSYLV